MKVKVKLKELSKLAKNNKALEDKILNAQAEAVDWKKKWSVAVAKQVSLEQSIKENTPKGRLLSEVADYFSMTERDVCDIVYGEDSKIYPNTIITQDEWMFLGGYVACREYIEESCDEPIANKKERGWHSMSHLPVESKRNQAFSETVELLTVNDTIVKGFFYLTEDACKDLAKGFLTTYDNEDKEIANIDQSPSGFRKWRYIYKSEKDS